MYRDSKLSMPDSLKRYQLIYVEALIPAKERV